MHKLRRFYYQNKEKIWKVILITALVLGIIYFLNSRVIDRKNSELAYEQIPDEYHYSDSESTYISGTAAVSGAAITQSEAEKVNNTISKFLEYCKNGATMEAYDMISEDCKKDRYSTLDKFANQYVNTKFSKGQTYTVQKWQMDTYKIDISQDMLATGNIDNSKKQIEYITIVEQGEEDKLNISGYIGKKAINAQETQDDITIKVIEKNIYMEYEEYNFEIQNVSNKVIRLDSLEKTGTIYLTDTDGNKYQARMHEILGQEVTLSPKHTFELSIKFTNAYSANRAISSITFENLILDYNSYKKLEDKNTFTDMCEFSIVL